MGLTTPQAIVVAAIILAVAWIIGKVIERSRTIVQQVSIPSFPEGGAPIQPTGQPVTESTFLEPGMAVQVEWEGSWWSGKVLSVASNGDVKIHYVGWEDSWDEYVPRKRLRTAP